LEVVGLIDREGGGVPEGEPLFIIVSSNYHLAVVVRVEAISMRHYVLMSLFPHFSAVA